MSLTTYADIEQGTDEWLDIRRGIVTASVVGRLLTPTWKIADNESSRGLTALLVSERITGWTEPTFTSGEMLRGIYDEPLAVDKYSQHYAPVQRVGFMERDDWGWRLGYSPDGVVGSDGLVEVKSRSPKNQVRTVVQGAHLDDVMPQMQCGMLVADRAWCDYLSYAGGMALYRVRVEADPKQQQAIVDAVGAFEARAAEMISAYLEAVDGMPMTERGLVQDMVV